MASVSRNSGRSVQQEAKQRLLSVAIHWALSLLLVHAILPALYAPSAQVESPRACRQTPAIPKRSGSLQTLQQFCESPSWQQPGEDCNVSYAEKARKVHAHYCPHLAFWSLEQIAYRQQPQPAAIERDLIISALHALHSPSSEHQGCGCCNDAYNEEDFDDETEAAKFKLYGAVADLAIRLSRSSKHNPPTLFEVGLWGLWGLSPDGDADGLFSAYRVAMVVGDVTASQLAAALMRMPWAGEALTDLLHDARIVACPDCDAPHAQPYHNTSQILKGVDNYHRYVHSFEVHSVLDVWPSELWPSEQLDEVPVVEWPTERILEMAEKLEGILLRGLMLEALGTGQIPFAEDSACGD